MKTKQPKKIGDVMYVQLLCNTGKVRATIVDEDEDGYFVKGRLFEDEEDNSWETFVKKEKKKEKKKDEKIESSEPVSVS